MQHFPDSLILADPTPRDARITALVEASVIAILDSPAYSFVVAGLLAGIAVTTGYVANLLFA